MKIVIPRYTILLNLLDLLVNRLFNIYKFYFNNYEFIDVVVNFLQSSDLGFRKMDGFVIHWSFLIGHQVQRSLCIICYIFILQETLSTNPPLCLGKALRTAMFKHLLVFSNSFHNLINKRSFKLSHLDSTQFPSPFLSQ